MSRTLIHKCELAKDIIAYMIVILVPIWVLDHGSIKRAGYSKRPFETKKTKILAKPYYCKQIRAWPHVHV